MMDIATKVNTTAEMRPALSPKFNRPMARVPKITVKLSQDKKVRSLAKKTLGSTRTGSAIRFPGLACNSGVEDVGSGILVLWTCCCCCCCCEDGPTPAPAVDILKDSLTFCFGLCRGLPDGTWLSKALSTQKEWNRVSELCESRLFRRRSQLIHEPDLRLCRSYNDEAWEGKKEDAKLELFILL